MQYPNWFEPYARPLFEKYLLPLAGKPNLAFLQIGAYKGDATSWLCQHVLTGEGSILTDVDTWRGSDEPEHGLFDWADIELLYDQRTVGLIKSGRLIKFKGTSGEYFSRRPGFFNFVYVDGDHTPGAVFADGVAASNLIWPGGFIAFDDYQWRPHGGGEGPGSAVDELIALRSDLTVLELSAQAWFRA